MGICMHTPTREGDMGYISFGLMRQRVAELYDEEVHREYMKVFDFGREETDEDVERRERLYAGSDERGRAVLSFLYASDCEGVIDWVCAGHLLEVCESAPADERSRVYGYAVRPDAFTFGDFIDMLRECVEDSCPLWWR